MVAGASSHHRKTEANVSASLDPVNALTIDVEDYFHVEAFSGSIPRADWDAFPSRVVENTARILDLLDALGLKATFFVLGWVARKAPFLVTEIARRGHEVGCHSMWHRLVYSMRPEDFRADLKEATSRIADCAQTPLRGYRAPSFSITRKSLWALEILAEEGYSYDSSIFPIYHDVYGFPGFPRLPVEVQIGMGGAGDGAVNYSGARTILEFPPSTLELGKLTLPALGGGYLRIFPLAYSSWALRRLARRDRAPAMVYFHPWELDPAQPRMAGPLRSRLRHYTGLGRMEGKLRRLLRRFRFTTAEQALDAYRVRDHLALGSAGLRTLAAR
jgi:polysaccharide deacetylase family protein (PEP-CTERM system associated)